MGVVDVPQGNSLASELLPKLSVEDLYSSDFDEARRHIITVFEGISESMYKKDIYILEHIGPVLEGLIIADTKFSVKKQVSVFMTQGILHRPVCSSLLHVAEQQRRLNQSTLPQVTFEIVGEEYDPGSILERHFLKNEDFRLDDQELKLMAARVYLCGVIRDTSPLLRGKIIVQVANQSSLDEIGNIYEYAKARTEGKEITVIPEVAGIFSTLNALGKDAYYSS